MNTIGPEDRTRVDGIANRRIPRCDSCGQKVRKRDRETFERIGLCQQCALRELEPLANSLVDTFCHFGAPDTLAIAKDHGWASYHKALLELALELYSAGWRLTRTERVAKSG
jgi:hypothetical protein